MNKWRVAKTRPIPITSANPYKAFTKISGRHAENVHIKLHFFDQNNREMAVSYISRPDERKHFDEAFFDTLFVSPKGAKAMEISFLSVVKPDKRIYWWLHDFRIEDLSSYSTENKIVMPKILEPNDRLFVRFFKNERGGNLKFKIGSQFSKISTKSKIKNQFHWQEVQIPKSSIKDKKSLTIINESGFNAINDLIIIDKDELKSYVDSVSKKVKESERTLSVEAEHSLTFTEDYQSPRHYPELSGGQSIAIFDTPVFFEFDTITPRTFGLKLAGQNLNTDLEIELLTKNKTIFRNKILVEKPLLSSPYFYRKPPHSIFFKPESLKKPGTHGTFTTRLPKLEPGKYKIQIQSTRPAKSLLDISKMKELSLNIKPKIHNDESNKLTCCQCSLKNSIEKSIDPNGNVNFSVISKNTCQWHIIQSEILAIEKHHEYFLDYEYYNQNSTDSHQKILFLDDDFKEVDVHYIDREQRDDNQSGVKKRLLFTPPASAKKMVVLFMFRGVFEEASLLQLREMRLIDHHKLAKIDFLQIQSAPTKTEFPMTLYVFQNSLHKLFSIENERSETLEPLPVNGFQMGAISERGQRVYRRIPAESYYKILLFLATIGFLAFVIFVLRDLRQPR